MSRGISREMINVNSLETINAAANAITSADFRVSPPVVQKRRWSISWGGYWCFGSQKNKQRFGHAVLVPEPTPTPSRNQSGALSIIQNAAQSQSQSMRTLFVAPPSSPASFLPSESDPPSASQSPVGLMYSPPGGPHSMFVIGPYAHETQLVTPPVLSNYTTEPSTAPFTPPPESPEVPFAQLLHPLHPTSDLASTSPSLQYDFLSYLLHPGSPVGPLISPNSALSASATSSPFPAYPHFTGDQALQESDGRDDYRNKRVCDNAADGSERGLVTANDSHLHQKNGISLGSMSEFNFDHINGMNSSEKASISWSWWANEKVVGKGGEVSKNWSFFHTMQHQPGGPLAS